MIKSTKTKRKPKEKTPTPTPKATKVYEFPNQKCVVDGCRKTREVLLVFEGMLMNLCPSHYEQFDQGETLAFKPLTSNDVMRVIREPPRYE